MTPGWSNLWAVEQVSLYNYGVHFWPQQPTHLAFASWKFGGLLSFCPGHRIPRMTPRP